MVERWQREPRRALQPQEDAQQDARTPEQHEQEAPRRVTGAERLLQQQEPREQRLAWPQLPEAPLERHAKAQRALRQQAQQQRAWLA